MVDNTESTFKKFMICLLLPKQNPRMTCNQDNNIPRSFLLSRMCRESNHTYWIQRKNLLNEKITYFVYVPYYYQFTHRSLLVVFLPILLARQFSTHIENSPGSTSSDASIQPVPDVFNQVQGWAASQPLKLCNFNFLQEFEQPLCHARTHVILHE